MAAEPQRAAAKQPVKYGVLGTISHVARSASGSHTKTKCHSFRSGSDRLAETDSGFGSPPYETLFLC